VHNLNERILAPGQHGMMHVVRVLVTNLILGALVVAAAALALAADHFWPFALPKQLDLLAWPLLILGTFLILAAEYSFITVAHATGAPTNAPRQLVATGLYRYKQNVPRWLPRPPKRGDNARDGQYAEE
jgi:hypothetical protein